MSRIGKNPVVIPAGVQVSVDENIVSVKGPKGELSERLPASVAVAVAEGSVSVSVEGTSGPVRSAHGLSRSLIQNMVTGVTAGFSKTLIIDGVGYRWENKGSDWILFTLGYSHPILWNVPAGLTATINPKENSITISGASRQAVGAAAAEIRSMRPPEPYKGKGIRYSDEVIRRKEGKTGK